MAGSRKPGAGAVFVGPSGWSYRSWRQTVARGVRMSDRLPFVSTMFNSVEINGSFYRQIAPATYRSWREQTPPGFRFALKGHRYVTHYRRLGNSAEAIERLRRQADGLGDKLAVVLWQLPSTVTVDLARLDDFIVAVGAWSDVRHALEFRHRSWFNDDVAARLADAKLAVCLSDAPDFPLWNAVTTDLVYVRLHGHTRKYASHYSRASLATWARRARAWAAEGRAVHIYFDNDAEGAAIKDGRALAEALKIGPAVGPGALDGHPFEQI